MPTKEQLDLAKKYGYTQEQINQEIATPGSVKRSAAIGTPTYEQPVNNQYASTTPTVPTVPKVPDVGQQSTGTNAQGETTYNFGVTTPPVAQTWETVGKQKDPTQVSNYLNSQSGFKTTVSGNTVTGTKNGVQTTWVNDGTNWVVKPTIATGDNPVIGTPPATTPITTTTDFTTMTPEQLKSRYMEIGTKLPGEVTDEDRKFTRYLQTRMSLGETPDVIFGTKGTKSSGTTTYSTELTQPGENIASSERQTDGTYKVTYKDGTTQITTSEPSTTVFPEGTPEYFAQKQAQEANKRLQVLEEQLNTEAERRKKETADLVAKYGENIANQFQTQKAEIEANGAKRMDTLNSGLSFSGFGRSTLALEKRDEIAKNIETTINQAKAKADLELMAYRMEREGADAEAISAMRTNIANVQQKIDDANYANQLEIIKLNQENATTGAEAMNNLLATISDSEEIVSNADIEKSQMLGYFVNKDGSIMLDSQKRPIQFEGNPGNLDPSAIGAYADALSKGIIDEKGLDKLSPSDKAAVLKHVSVKDNTYVPVAQGSGEYTMAKIFGKTVKLDTVAMPSFQAAMAQMPPNTVIGAQQFRTPEEQARLKAEGKSWTLDSNHMKGLAVDIYYGDPSRKPSAEQIAIMNKNGWYQDPALMAKGDYGHFDYKGIGGVGKPEISQTDIAVFNNLTPTATKEAQNDPKFQEFITKKNEIMTNPDADIQDVIKYSQGGKDISDTSETQLAKYGQAFAQVGELSKSIQKSTTGPVWGRIQSMNPYNTDAQTLNAQISALIPNLARGVYGEVGVLTDADVAQYTKTVPNLKSTEAVNKAILAMTLHTIANGYKSKLQSLANAGRDVSGYSGTYTKLMSQVNSLLKEIGADTGTTPTGQTGASGTVTAGAFDLDA